VSTHVNTGEPAFPFTEMHTHGSPYTQWKGMTLRDYFAAKAMQGDFNAGVSDNEFDAVAKRAYKAADAMLEAREK
jgi:hypothetical protein